MTPIIFKLIDDKIPVSKIVVMVQKEVGNRFKATINTKDYNSLPIYLNYYYITSAYNYPSSATRKYKYFEIYGEPSQWTSGIVTPWADVFTSNWGTYEWNWTFEDAGNGFYYIKPEYNNSWCLDAEGANATVGTRVLAYTCSPGSYNQIWELSP